MLLKLVQTEPFTEKERRHLWLHIVLYSITSFKYLPFHGLQTNQKLSMSYKIIKMLCL